MASYLGSLVFAFWLGAQVQARWPLGVSGDTAIILLDILAIAVYSAWHFGLRLTRRKEPR